MQELTEIPKDGKSYLAWHKDYGMRLVAWHKSMGRYEDDWGPYQREAEFARWMDERGNWHEVKDE